MKVHGRLTKKRQKSGKGKKLKIWVYLFRLQSTTHHHRQQHRDTNTPTTQYSQSIPPPDRAYNINPAMAKKKPGVRQQGQHQMNVRGGVDGMVQVRKRTFVSEICSFQLTS